MTPRPGISVWTRTYVWGCTAGIRQEVYTTTSMLQPFWACYTAILSMLYSHSRSLSVCWIWVVDVGRYYLMGDFVLGPETAWAGLSFELLKWVKHFLYMYNYTVHVCIVVHVNAHYQPCSCIYIWFTVRSLPTCTCTCTYTIIYVEYTYVRSYQPVNSNFSPLTSHPASPPLSLSASGWDYSERAPGGQHSSSTGQFLSSRLIIYPLLTV